MTTQIYSGRYTAQSAQPFVVFLIGMRINRFLKFRSWLPVMRAMGPMVQNLYRHPEKGFLGAENFFNGRTTLMLSYWRSFADLERFARSPSDPHLPAWRMFRQTVGDDGSVGIWHETYQVAPGEFESIYGNMPRFGLARAFDHLPVSAGRHSAAQRKKKGSGVIAGLSKTDFKEVQDEHSPELVPPLS